MKELKIIGLLTCLLTSSCYAQFKDNFTDGDFTTNPVWQGDHLKFSVNAGKLKLQAPAVSESAFLTTPSQAIHNGSWEFYLQMDFNPSSSNYAKIFMVSDQSNTLAALNGYFVKVGNTAREISLYRQTGLTETKIIDGLDDRINLPIVKVKIKVTRNAVGNWQLFSDVGPSGNYVLEGAFTDATHTLSYFFGIQCNYTSTRSDKFWFDDFIVADSKVPDTTPPAIQTAITLNAQQIQLLFSEPLQLASAQNGNNYRFENLETQVLAGLESDQRTVDLNISPYLTNGITYSMQVSGVMDLAGNAVVPANVNILFFQPVASKVKDVIFTEIFPDPSPKIGLPGAEFVEILNRTANPFNLGGWKLSDGSSIGTFPSQIILPGEYWIVTAAASINLFSGYDKIMGLANFPTLNNDSDFIILKNELNVVIDSIHYELGWYRDVDKQEGGWTLELIDPDNPCGEEGNWTASESHTGGTPGHKNSVFANKPDVTPPTLISVFPESDTCLTLQFDEKLESGPLPIEYFALLPTLNISQAYFKDISLRTIALDVSGSLLTRQFYSLDVTNIRDCSGNMILPVSFLFGLPEKADSLDVVVNEILFNPRAGGVDFVEIVNASPKFLNLKNWKIGNDSDGVTTAISLLFSKDQLLRPRTFAVLTTDPLIIKSQYAQSITENIFKTLMPGLPDDQGSIVLLDNEGTRINEVTYSKDWHSKFIKNDEGVSLERIDINTPANDPANWTSASSVAGFATPGFANSQQRTKNDVAEGEVLIVPEIFSPGNDMHDFIQIQYRFDQGGWVANVKVYDQQAHLLRTVANNETLGPEGFFRWDGDRDDGGKTRLGYYVVRFEIFNAMGSVRTFMKRVVVSSR